MYSYSAKYVRLMVHVTVLLLYTCSGHATNMHDCGIWGRLHVYVCVELLNIIADI